MSTIGIDIGGTKIIFVLLKGRKIVKFWKILTPKNRLDLLKALKNNIPQEVKSIGIGVPGPLNKEGDLILNPPNLKFLWNFPLAKVIANKTGIKTKMDNDANCFALGEALLGAGKGANIVAGITLGTGVGGGIVINGNLYRGAFGSGGEFGHMSIKFDGRQCTCGSYGCLEEYASTRFFKNLGKNYKEYGKYVGIGLSNIINILDPEVIVIGGGIASSYDDFIREARKEISKRVISPISKKYVKIKKAAFGDLAGAVGAALLINH